MKRKNHSSAFAVALSTCLLIVVYALPAMAQQTSSAIRGVVSNQNGPVSGVEVRVTDTRTGASRTVTSNATGVFYVANLPVGGPYRVKAGNAAPVLIERIELGDTYQLALNYNPGNNLEEVTVTGSQMDQFDVAAGPSATFSQYDIDNAIALNRDIKEVYSFDPRLNIDNPESGSALNCIGKHPRFNGISLDGVSQVDRFGLNENGYSTATGQPFPYEAISQVAVELAPFDVTYGGFTACNIDAVTKSGTNEWTGSVFYEYTSDSLRGDKVQDNDEDVDIPSESFDQNDVGFSIGGPIIKDKLFFFAAFETFEAPRFVAQGYNGSGSGVERDWLSASDYNRILNIARNVYGYDPGGQPGNGDRTQDKALVRLDWNINDQHSASVIYNYYDGEELRASDGDSNEFEFSNHFYTKGSENKSLILKVNSQWTDALSTEFYFSRAEMDDSQVTVGDKEFADMQISIDRNTVYLGADDSRQANALSTESDFFKLTGEYLWCDHLFTAGYEREDLDIFNLFVQHSRGGEYDFFDDSANGGLSGIDKFEQGLPNRIYYGSGGGTNIATDAAATFTNTQNTLYIQDEYYFADKDLTLVGGLRYEWFESDDRPRFNQAFADANNGLRNDANVDDIDLLMPRFGFNWGASDKLTIRGGLGLYSGGNPNVWISNAYSNDGITNVQLRESFAESIFDLDLSGQGRPGYDVPQSMVDDVAAVTDADASSSFLVILDPDYDQPSEWKAALGATMDFDNGWTADVDLIFSRIQDPAYYVDLSQSIVGTTAAGTPIYDYANGRDNFMLTNSDEDADSFALSTVFSKEFDFGIDLDLGYAYTDAEDVSPMTSAVAGSNFDNLALLDIGDPKAGTTNYETEHRFTVRMNYGTELFGKLWTNFTVYGFFKSGQPQSYVMGSRDLEGDGFFGRHLLYVPTGPNDPNVVYAPGFDQAGFEDFVRARGLGTGFVDRNDDTADWSHRFDLRITQELPVLFGDVQPKVYLKINNVLNFLNDDWGAQYDNQFFSQQIVDATINDQGQFVYDNFRNRDVNDLIENSSVWSARLGLQISF